MIFVHVLNQNLSNRSHDYDKNMKLDGLELMAALGHVVQFTNGHHGLEEKHVKEAEGMEVTSLSFSICLSSLLSIFFGW
mgnify:CR=1 FL=1